MFSATTRDDKVVYVLLVAPLLLGLGTKVIGNVTAHAHDYRVDVSPWFRSIFYFRPDTHLILRAPIGFRLHVLSAFVLFAFWPLSRLVHVFSAPIGYLTRPYIVYRSRDDKPRGTHAATRMGARRMNQPYPVEELPVDLAAVGAELLATLNEDHASGRAANTIFHQPGVRATVIALRAGHELASTPHRQPRHSMSTRGRPGCAAQAVRDQAQTHTHRSFEDGQRQ